jgi:uroporphyrin-3 C-methyltransferase/uroporphyrinogen III methyltransferase/synthase
MENIKSIPVESAENLNLPNSIGQAKSRESNLDQPNAQWLGKAAFFISVLTFILLLLVAFAGKNQIEKTRLAFGERIQKEATTLDLVKEEIGKSSDIAKDLKTRFELLELAQKEEASQRSNLENVYNSLLASRTEVSLSEVEQLISIAKRQLYLLGNVTGASIALTQAIDLLEETDKPSLLNLRIALEKDLSEIKALPSDDLLRFAISLDSAVSSVDSLPMLSSAIVTPNEILTNEIENINQNSVIVPQFSNSEKSAVVTEKASSVFETVWITLKNLFKTVWGDIKSLVEVTKIDSPEVLKLSSRQEIDVRNTLRLSLLNARMTLLSRQAALLKSDLDRSKILLQTYFDDSSLQVQRVQSVIDEINEVQLNLILPELQSTTAALRLALAGQMGDKLQ